MSSPEGLRSLDILNRIAEQAPKDDQRLQNYVAALREQLELEGKQLEEQAQLVQQYEEAYQKLTQPANRLGVFLNWIDDEKILIALGDTEFVALFDPAVDKDALVSGSRVSLNDAYAVVGVLPPHPGGSVMKVAEALENGLLRVGSDPQNLQGRIVARADAIMDAKIDKGDEVRIDPSGRVALEHYPHQEVRDYFVEEIPELPWSKIGGQDQAIQLIRDTIEQPLLYPELYAQFDKKPIKGILLYGPPGCGKTLLGRATAYNIARDYSERMGHEVKEYFMHISGPKILNMWLGETERMVREIFETARARAKEGKLVVIFMDEAESILRTRSSGRYLNISNTVVPQFCAELDGIVSLDNVVLILTSNRPDYIDPAILRPERIDRKVKVNRPDRNATREILGIYLHDRLPLDPALIAEYDNEPSCARKELLEATTAYIWRKAKETEFLKVFMRSSATETLYWKDMVSGALLKSIVDRAKDSAIRRAIADQKTPQGLTLEDLTEAADAEYRENEIFPKADVLDDWLKLIDLDPESVATVKPIRTGKGEEFIQKNVI